MAIKGEMDEKDFPLLKKLAKKTFIPLLSDTPAVRKRVG